jgi:hypothetical protein
MDPAPLDQLEKCRKPDDRHLGGRSRRCDEMSFLLYRSGSVRAKAEWLSYSTILAASSGGC